MTHDEPQPERADPTADITNLDEMLGLERVDPALSDIRRDRWIGLLEQTDEDLSSLAINRMAWRALTAVWRERQPPLPPSFVFDVWARTYAHTQASGIRRQADRRNDVASLVRLLGEVERHPDLISRQFFIGRYEWGMQHIGHREFANLDPSGTGHLDPSIVKIDLEELNQTAEGVVQWVHKTVAHLSEVPAQSVPTFDELDRALDTIGRIFRRWICVLTGGDLIDLEPFPQYDWLAPLRVPWITT